MHPYPLTLPPGPLGGPPYLWGSSRGCCRRRAPPGTAGVVVDVLDLDDELGLGLHWLLGAPFDGLRLEHVEGLLLAVQLAARADLARVLVDLEGVASSLSRQDVADAVAPAAVVRLQLGGGDAPGET